MRALLCLLLISSSPLFAAGFQIATSEVDVTIPLGHGCMGGGIAPARKIVEPLQAKGFALFGGDKPFVVLAFDWCEIRGSAFEDWRNALAETAGTTPERVMITSTHVHDAPVMDPEAEFLLRDAEKSGAWKSLPAPDPKERIQLASVCWPDFNRLSVQRAREALSKAMAHRHDITHFGTGKARVKDVASNRRYTSPDGQVHYNRMSRTADPMIKAADEGLIDPWLRTFSFWNGDELVCALHSYAVHPMSFYGSGDVSIDFVGLAREQLQKELPGALQIYASGCSGNVTAGKFNNGDAGSRAELTEKMHAAMAESLRTTQKQPLTTLGFRQSQIALGARNTLGYTEDELRYRLTHEPRPFGRAEAAMGLAWYERVKAGHQVDLPLIDFGPAQLVLLPAESYVEYQLYAEGLHPDHFVMVMGYGECGPGYIPVERAWLEHDSNLRDWAWVPPGSEAVMKKAIEAVMKKP